MSAGTKIHSGYSRAVGGQWGAALGDEHSHQAAPTFHSTILFPEAELKYRLIDATGPLLSIFWSHGSPPRAVEAKKLVE